MVGLRYVCPAVTFLLKKCKNAQASDSSCQKIWDGSWTCSNEIFQILKLECYGTQLFTVLLKGAWHMMWMKVISILYVSCQYSYYSNWIGKYVTSLFVTGHRMLWFDFMEIYTCLSMEPILYLGLLYGNRTFRMPSFAYFRPKILFKIHKELHLKCFRLKIEQICELSMLMFDKGWILLQNLCWNRWTSSNIGKGIDSFAGITFITNQKSFGVFISFCVKYLRNGL